MEIFLSKLYLYFVFLCVTSIECNLQSHHERQSSVNAVDKELKNGAVVWNCPFTDSFNESMNWHIFLNSLYCKFSKYKMQIAKRNYRVNHTAEFEKQDCEIEELIHKVQRTQIDENNFEKFLNKTVKCNITEFSNIENITATGVKIEELNHVLNLTLRDRLLVNCEETHICIKGNFITTGDIIDILILKRRVTDAKCKTLLSTNKTKFVNVFALNTFFIDDNINSSTINSHKIILMSVIAPKWENIGKNKIELKGEDGEILEVGNGMDGKPGKPGNPGGSFFGIGRVFVNGINLQIAVSGRNGSPGQGGRKGENGIDGISPTTPSSKSHCGVCGPENEKLNDFDCKRIECKRAIGDSMRPYNITSSCKIEIFGKAGTRGKHGGKGGKGGIGGNPGNISLIELKNPSHISLVKNTGQDGKDGKGGVGGFGGRKGNAITAECEVHCKWWRTNCWSLINTKISHEKAQMGQNGADGGNTNGMENPKFSIVINNIDKAKIINQYKSFLRENLNGRLKNYFLQDFLKDLESNINVKKVYDTLGLIDELELLEEQFHKLSNDKNYIQFYQSLLNRISEYSHTLQEIGDLGQYKKVLCYLYTATLGRIHNIQDNIESNLIIDIYAYLSSVKNDIARLTDLKNAKYKETLINKYKDEYKHEIDMKINEAKELISKEITPEIYNIGTEIDSQMEILVNEVIYLQEQTEKEHKDLVKKQEQLENILGLQGIFSVFKIFGAIVNFLGPVGDVAGSTIEIGNSIAESFISDNDVGEKKIFELPQSVSKLQSISNKIKKIVNQRISCLKNSVEGISLEIIKHPDILNNMLFKILNIKDTLDKLDESKLNNFKEIKDLEKELDAALQTQEQKLDKKNETHVNLIKSLKRIVQLSRFLPEFYRKYKYNLEKQSAINHAIEKNEKKLKKLKKYEEDIYDSIIPMLQNIQNDLQNIISKLGTKSKVALDVTKWHVQSTLKDMILRMNQLTRGFEVEDNLARCLEKLEETMDALVNVHQHIQDYQKDQNLANYISEISSITVSDIIIGNNEVLQEALRHAVRNLEITVRSNIVLQRYKIAMNAFKQFVFPFAHNYFKDLILPSHLVLDVDRSNTTLNNLISKVATEVEQINSKLEDYKNTVTNRDKCIGIGGFQSGYISTKPFFVWKNEQYKNMISKLLSGDTVMIKAGVRNSAPDKDAIKFNIIDFNFKSRNESLQSEINNKLKGFQITIDHLGNSDYRYENKIYEMMTGSQEIWYYFEKKANGEPVHYSLSYKKIMYGNVTLSPYASWKIKLENVTDFISFNDLEIYKDSVDLTLEGHGYFLNKKSRNCIDLMVDKYYKAIGTYFSGDSNADSYDEDIQYVL